MTLALTQTTAAVAPNVPASFLAVGGTAPYAYQVLPGGAGGTINAATGAYTAPAVAQSALPRVYDAIRVTDALAATSTSTILVGTPLLLFCDVIQKEMELADGRVYLWDQKIMQPTDSDLYIAISVASCKPFANVNRQTTTPLGDYVQEQVVNMLATCDIDIISRGPAARDRKEEIILALNSIYAQQQQEINSFYIGKLPPGGRFVNLSEVDGAAIPYRFRISVNLQYAFVKTKSAPYDDSFETKVYTEDQEADVPLVMTSNYTVLYPTLSGSDVVAKQYILPRTPADPTKVEIDVLGASGQQYATDFTVAGNIISWDGLGLEALALEGVALRISFFAI